MTKTHLGTGQNGQKRSKNHKIVPEKGLKLIIMTDIPLKSPNNEQKSLKNWSNWPKTAYESPKSA